MKKFLAMMLALLMVLSLAACGGNKDAAGDQPAEITGTLSAAAYHATGDADALATELRGAIQDHQWMCGFPDKVVVAVRDAYVVVVFGADELVDDFASRLSGIFGMKLAYDEALQV